MQSTKSRLGKLIVVEGTDGSGKTTSCKKFSDYINNHPEEFDGYKAMSLSLPYNDGSEIYKKIRELLTLERFPTDILQSLMIVNMRDTFNNIIIPKLENEKIIIVLDRWLLSTLVYNMMSKGNIFDSAVRYLCSTKSEANTSKLNLDIADHETYLDINEFSSDYCGLDIFPDRVFLLVPGLGILKKHCNMRMGKEVNDRFENVSISNEIYRMLFNSLMGKEEPDILLDKRVVDKTHNETYEKIYMITYSASTSIPNDKAESEFYDYVQHFLKQRTKSLIQG